MIVHSRHTWSIHRPFPQRSNFYEIQMRCKLDSLATWQRPLVEELEYFASSRTQALQQRSILSASQPTQVLCNFSPSSPPVSWILANSIELYKTLPPVGIAKSVPPVGVANSPMHLICISLKVRQACPRKGLQHTSTRELRQFSHTTVSAYQKHLLLFSLTCRLRTRRQTPFPRDEANITVITTINLQGLTKK